MATYQLISSVTVGSGGAANIQFTSIPATYTDLLLVTSLRGTSSDVYASMTFNGSNTLSWRYLEGNGSTASSGSGAINMGGMVTPSSATANTFSNGQVYIPNYAGSNQKSSSSDSVTENNGTTAYPDLSANLNSLTSAVTTITLTPNVASFAQYSTAYLYGIKNS